MVQKDYKSPLCAVKDTGEQDIVTLSVAEQDENKGFAQADVFAVK